METSNSINIASPLPHDHERVKCPACGGHESSPVRTSADIVQCRQCEMVYLRTRLTRDAMRKLYQSYAEAGSHMALPKSLKEAGEHGLKRDYFLKEIMEFVPPGGGFLDVGCGWGAFLLNSWVKGFQPRGIELTNDCLNYAVKELGIPVANTQLEDTEIIPGSLRVVTMNHVLEHLPEPRKALRKVLDSLEPGGMYCGIVPNFSSVCSGILKEKWYWLDPNYHYQHFTPATLRKMLSDAGFTVERIYTATGDYSPELVQKACLSCDGKFADENYFKTALERIEKDGRGEEIRFFARKGTSSNGTVQQLTPTVTVTSSSTPISKHRIGFALSTKERMHFTERILPSLDCGGFDLIWCDGSTTPEGKAFANARHFKKTPLVDVYHGVGGGPDAAIQFSLKRLLEKGYDYVGLIENDIQFKPGWLPAMMAAWQAAEKDGFNVGSVTSRSMVSRVLGYGPEYVIKWNMGAGMVLFSRAAAEAVLADYAITSAKEVRHLFQSSTSVDFTSVWEIFREEPDRVLGMDWRYASSMWKQGMISVGTVPCMAENIDADVRDCCRTEYVSRTGTPWHTHSLTIEKLKAALVSCAPCATVPPPFKAGHESSNNNIDKSSQLACPACQTLSPPAVVKNSQVYHRCPECSCVFTSQIPAPLLAKEDHASAFIHAPNQDVFRLQQITEALGEYPEHLVHVGPHGREIVPFLEAKGIQVTSVDLKSPTKLQDITSESMDGVVMIESLEHLSAPHEIFPELARILKTGGVIYIESGFTDENNVAAWEYVNPRFGHCTIHSHESLKRLAEHNGFSLTWTNTHVCCLAKQPVTKDVEAINDINIIGVGIAELLVTVVISTKGEERSIRSCLKNISRQTIFNRCEIIILDSGLPPVERAAIIELQKSHPNIRHALVPKEASSRSWNRVLKAGRGRYWVNLNINDSFSDDALEILTAALERNIDCALAYGDTASTPNRHDAFPSIRPLGTVKYFDYLPIHTLFHDITNGLFFWRMESLRQMGGFDSSLNCAGNYEVSLKMMCARLNAAHIKEVLAQCYDPSFPTKTTGRAAKEHTQIMQSYRANLDITKIFQVRTNDAKTGSNAWAMLGIYAMKFAVPGEQESREQNDFALACFHKALDLDPENQAAGTHLVGLTCKLERLTADEPELVRRWPKMRDWINFFRMGEGMFVPDIKYAVLGPVYRPNEWTHRPTTEQLLREPVALRPWIYRVDGRHVYLSEHLFPAPAGNRYTKEELHFAGQRLLTLLRELPPFYAHIGGAGDALLLLAAFYDKKPDGVVFSHPNGIGAARALFDAFPKLSKIYFLPQNSEPFFHAILRYGVYELKNCLGAGATPKHGYDDEWKASLDIHQKYGINKYPRWAADFRKNNSSRRVALAPKGSLSGMVGSKRNIIRPEFWSQVIEHILKQGFEPVILGMPNEAKDFPTLPGCLDLRHESFAGQMRGIGECAGLVGADSWAKTFSALAKILTVVFEPMRGVDIANWKDPSDWVFIEPWPEIKMANSLDHFRRLFDAHIAKLPGTALPDATNAPIVWEGSYLDYGSLSHINREVTSRLKGLNLACVSPNVSATSTAADPAIQQCAKKLVNYAPPNVAVTVRHQWPPNWSKPASGSLIIIQPWEFGSLPIAWVQASVNVDEFWVPSPIVRAMYINSGVAPEKVRVVPNGVDSKKFRPGVRPLPLATKKKFKFLFVGGTIFRKGPDILLEAFSQAFTAADDVCLVIKDFGGNSFYQGQTAEAAIRALQQNPNAPEILYLKDEISSEQMPSLYTACHCLVLPYRGEGFGMPVLEAMACGLPVVVTASGATDSFVAADMGWKIPAAYLQITDRVGDIPLVKPGWMLQPSKPYLTEILKYIATHPDECRRRGANGRAVVERQYDWNDIAAGIAHRLKELAERSPVALQPKTGTKMASQKTTTAKLPDVAYIGQLAEARALFTQKNYEATWNAAVAAIAKRPFHPEAFLLLAEIAAAAGDVTNARLCAQHARDIAPTWNPAAQFLKKSLKDGEKPAWLKLPEAIQRSKSKTQSLSVCLIVKNEEKFLPQCLKSISLLAQQIIVVDTGSTDRTVAIAKELGAEVYSHTWDDDFAAARNTALEHATCDWILILDADEELPVSQHAGLLADMKDCKAIAHRLPLINRGQENEGQSFVPRLFCNVPGAYYYGRIHEQVFPSLLTLSKPWGLKVAMGTAEILHHGYAKETLQNRNKIERNLKLLQAAMEENPGDVNLTMNLGLELVRADKLDAGIAKYREAFQLMSELPREELAPELREVLLTQFTSQLYKVQAYAEVVQVLNSSLAQHGGLTASLHLALGLSQFELKNFSEAAQQMRQCLAKRKQRSFSPINTDILTSMPNHCLALALWKINDVAGTEKAFEAALNENGLVENVKLDYAKFLAGTNRPVEALHKLHEMVAANGNNRNLWRTGGEIALGNPDFLVFARDWTSEAMRYAADDRIILAQRAEALMLNGDTAAAGELWERIWNTDKQPRSLAALILCQAIESQTTHASEEGPDEISTSQAFIAWYQRLIAMRAKTVIARINEQTDKLSRALPTATRMIEKALGKTPASSAPVNA